MIDSATKEEKTTKTIFPFEEVSQACAAADWEKIIAMINEDRLSVNYPFDNGQMIAPYPYMNKHQQQFTLLDHLQFRGAPFEIMQLLQTKFNALKYHDIYVFQCARAGRWDIITQLPYVNVDAKDILLGTLNLTLSDHAFLQGQLALADFYYSEKNSHFIKQTATPILIPKPIKPTDDSQDTGVVSKLEAYARKPVVQQLDKNIEAMFQAAETNNWQAVMHFIDNFACPPLVLNTDGKDLMYWAKFHNVDTMVQFLLREELLESSAPYTPQHSAQKQACDVGFVGREVQSLLAQNIEPTSENLQQEFQRLSIKGNQ